MTAVDLRVPTLPATKQWGLEVTSIVQKGTGEQGMRPPQMRLGPAEGQLRPFTDGQIREPEPGTRRRVV